MKLIVAVINNGQDKQKVCDALVQQDFRFTEIGSTSGFLRRGNTTLLIGVQEEQVETVLTLIRQLCQTRERMVNAAAPAVSGAEDSSASPMKVTLGGAKVFVLDVEQLVEV
jgi:uncharacterized protein YaaQ